jgi:hypothetical protein
LQFLKLFFREKLQFWKVFFSEKNGKIEIFYKKLTRIFCFFRITQALRKHIFFWYRCVCFWKNYPSLETFLNMFSSLQKSIFISDL